ncbi:MAG: ATP-binding protein [Spirochaetes bacterium]|nr:ATP-binding protein [Spirochaetota bacterium]
MNRRQADLMYEDLAAGKMVFLGGPRQVGKTTLSNQIAQKFNNPLYLNFDHPEDRSRIMKRDWKKSNDLIIFDELHKWRPWKSWLKGIYDKEGKDHRMLVTGSARLDVYRRGGDSMQGRYHYWRLHPFTMGEIVAMTEGNRAEIFERLFARGGFPEPYLAPSERALKRWQRERLERVIREDIFALESIRNLNSMFYLYDLLIERVGSPISLRALAEDLGVSPITVGHWIRVLEAMYAIFIITPYHKKLSRAVRKEYKVYFFDWSLIKDPGLRWENMLAAHLLQRCHFLQDSEGERCELNFLRDRDGHEVDFLLTQNGKPTQIIEAKLSETQLSPGLRYFAQKLKIESARQVVHNFEGVKESRYADVVAGADFLARL